MIVVDRETIGGQAGTSSLIRNYLGFPLGIGGAELCNRALDQAWSFGAETSVLRQATDLRTTAATISWSSPTERRSQPAAVVLATGASYQRLGIPSLESLVGAGVFYGGGITEAQAMDGQHVYVVGAGNSAGQAAIHLAKHAERVTMIVRGGALGASMSDYLVRSIDATENIDVQLHTTVIDGHGAGRLEELVLRNSNTGDTRTVPAAALFVLIGAQPHTEWLPEQHPTGPTRLRSHRRGPAVSQRHRCGRGAATALLARDQHARRVRGRRRSTRLSQTRGGRCRGGRHQHPISASVPGTGGRSRDRARRDSGAHGLAATTVEDEHQSMGMLTPLRSGSFGQRSAAPDR